MDTDKKLNPNNNSARDEKMWISSLQDRYSNSWVVRSISELLSVPQMDHTPRKLADLLKVDEQEVKGALDLLEQMGVIKKNGDKYIKIIKFVSFSDSYLDKQKLAENHSIVTQKLLREIFTSTYAQGGFYRSSFLATNKVLAEKYMHLLEDLLKDFLIQSEKSEKDTLFALSITATTLGESFKKPLDI